MAKKGMMQVQLEVVPGKGEVQRDVKEVPMTATTVGELARSLGIDIVEKTVLVNGAYATPETAVTANASVSIRVTERPKGS